MSRCYSLGARFLDDQPIFGIDPKATALTPVHFLRYFYYGGIIFAGVKRWKDALDSFLMVSFGDTPPDESWAYGFVMGTNAVVRGGSGVHFEGVFHLSDHVTYLIRPAIS